MPVVGRQTPSFDRVVEACGILLEWYQEELANGRDLLADVRGTAGAGVRGRDADGAGGDLGRREGGEAAVAKGVGRRGEELG